MPETSAARRAIRDRPARFLHRLHFYAGLMVGPFLLVAAISGAFYALAPTVEKVVYADLLTVDAAPHSVSVGEQVEAAAATSPGSSVAQIWPAHDPGDTTRVLFDDPSSTDKTLPAAFVDPATAAVVGEERTYSGLGELPVRRWLSGLHQHLHLGEPGELYAELAASWLWVLALGGLYLWWRRVSAARRRDPGTRTRLWRAAPAPQGDAGRRRRSLNLHAVLGVWLMVAILGLSATGITWSQKAGANVDAVVSALDWKAPKVDAALPPGSPGAVQADSSASAVSAQSDRVIAAARAEGLTGPLVLRPPAEAGEGWRVSERWVAWRTASDSIVVDGADGRVASRQPFAELPFFSKLSSWGIYLHMGIMFGLPLQLALFAAGVGIAVIIVLGYRMWWLRRPTVRGTSVPGLPDSPSWRIVAGVVVFAATVGAFLPLLGISLIGFLLLDLVLIGRARARRRAVEKQLEAAVLSGGTP